VEAARLFRIPLAGSSLADYMTAQGPLQNSGLASDRGQNDRKFSHDRSATEILSYTASERISENSGLRFLTLTLDLA
jgi:hypothetical protein